MAKLKSIEDLLADIRESVARCEMPKFNPDNKTAVVRFIKFAVSGHFGITVEDLDCPSRSEEFAWPRQIAMSLSRELTHLPSASVGAMFGGRDHGTVLHAQRRVSARAETEPHVRMILASFKQELYSHMEKQQNGNGVGK